MTGPFPPPETSPVPAPPGAAGPADPPRHTGPVGSGTPVETDGPAGGEEAVAGDRTAADAPVPPTGARRPSSALAAARPGDLTPTWRLVMGLVWIGAFFAYAAVWQVSVQIGIGTWWLGTRSQPTGMVLRAVPFVLVVAMCLAVVYQLRQASWLLLGGSVLAAVIALPDLSRSLGLATLELLIAAATAIAAGASFTGRYRLAPTERAVAEHTPDAPSSAAPGTAAR